MKDIVIINKPYGLPKEMSEDSQFSLVKALPHLAKKLDVSSLTVLKCSERFTSGITVLGSQPESEKAFKNCLLRQKTHRILANSYLALVKGQPKISRSESVDLSLPQINVGNFSPFKTQLTTPAKNAPAEPNLGFSPCLSSVHVLFSIDTNSSLMFASSVEYWSIPFV